MFNQDKDVSVQDKATDQPASGAFTIFIQQRKPKIIEENPNVTIRELRK